MKSLVLSIGIGTSLVVSLSWAEPAWAADGPAMYPKETETYLINYYAFAKDPTTALLLSTFIGFGTGHFYAEQWVTGVVMAAGQVVGAGLFALGTGLGGAAEMPLDVVGGVLFGGFKIADMFMAPYSVEKHNKHVAERLRLRPLISQVGPRAAGSVAWGLALEIPSPP